MPEWLQKAVDEVKSLSKDDAIQNFVGHIGDFLHGAEDLAGALKQVGTDLGGHADATAAAINEPPPEGETTSGTAETA